MLGQSVDSSEGQNDYRRRTYYKTLREGQLCVRVFVCVCGPDHLPDTHPPLQRRKDWLSLSENTDTLTHMNTLLINLINTLFMLRAIGSHFNMEWRCEKPHSLSCLSLYPLISPLPIIPIYSFHTISLSCLIQITPPSLLIHLSLSIVQPPLHTDIPSLPPYVCPSWCQLFFCLLTLSPSFCPLSFHLL